jgi:hypothetical protein
MDSFLGKVIWLKDIRNQFAKFKGDENAKTQAGALFYNILQSINGDFLKD